MAASSVPWRAHKVPDLALHVAVVRQRPQPRVNLVEGILFRGSVMRIDLDGCAIAHNLDGLGAGDDTLQRHPPQPACPLGEVAGGIDRERSAMRAHHRQRMVAVVAIAVVEGEAGKAPREIAFAHPAMRFVQRDDVDVERADMCQHLAQEFGRDLQMPVGLEQFVAGGPHVMQHEDGAGAGQQRPQHMMRAGEIQRVEAGANDIVAKLFHGGFSGADRAVRNPQIGPEPLNKRLSGPLKQRPNKPFQPASCGAIARSFGV